jgi:coatomer subunit delta
VDVASRTSNTAPVSTSAASSSRATAVKGMSLTKGGKSKSLEEALYKEDKLAPVALTSKSAPAEAAVAAQPTIQQPVMLVVAEKVCCKMTRDNMVESFEIKGSLTLTATTDEAALCSVQLAVSSADVFTFNTHPKVNKALYDKSHLLQLKDTTKGFPTARPVGILKWTYASTTDDLVPLKINCWPEEESRGQMNVSIEYSMDQKIELHDVRIRIPLGTSESPGIINVDGSYKHNSSTGELVWEIDMIDQSNSAGSLEFNIAQRSADAFFPIVVQFTSQQLYCNVQVTSVRTAGENADKPLQYGLSKSMSTEDYIVG